MNEPTGLAPLEQDGQQFVDEPCHPKRATHRFTLAARGIAGAVAHAFGAQAPRPIDVSVERFRLRWLESDGTLKADGTPRLVPRRSP